jgi:hypothetical protein
MRIGVFASRPARGGHARGQRRQEGWLSQTEVVQTTRQRDRAPIWATMTIADLNTATLGTISRVGEVRGRRDPELDAAIDRIQARDSALSLDLTGESGSNDIGQSPLRRHPIALVPVHEHRREHPIAAEAPHNTRRKSR